MVVERWKYRTEGDLADSGWHVLMSKMGAGRITERHSQVWGKRSMGVNRDGLSLDGTARRSGADKV